MKLRIKQRTILNTFFSLIKLNFTYNFRFSFLFIFNDFTALQDLTCSILRVIWCHGKFEIKSTNNKCTCKRQISFSSFTAKTKKKWKWNENGSGGCSTLTSQRNVRLRFIGLPNCDFIVIHYFVFIIGCVLRIRAQRVSPIALQKASTNWNFSLSIADRYRIIYGFNIAIIFIVCERRILPSPSSPSPLPSLLFLSSVFFFNFSQFPICARLFHCCHCFRLCHAI